MVNLLLIAGVCGTVHSLISRAFSSHAKAPPGLGLEGSTCCGDVYGADSAQVLSLLHSTEGITK